VHGGVAAWTQGSGAGGIGDVHVFDLRSGKDRVVRHGHPAGAFLLAGGLVVWPESLKPGALTLMQAAEVASGRGVAAPAAFRTMRGVSGLATDGTVLAYPKDDYTSLWWSPSLEALPLRVFATANATSHIDNSVQVAGGYAAFGVPPALFLAETEAHRYVQISSGGFALLDARSLILLKPSRKKAVHPVSDVVFRSLASLPPFPTCS